MEILILLALILAVAFHFYRQYWAHRDLEKLHHAPFNGEVFIAEETTIAISRPDSTPPVKTVICVPGFLEDMRYFLDLYEGQGYELILINNASYHSPFSLENARSLGWNKNPFSPATIEYDAFFVAKAMEDLVTTSDVVLHGHSRGGAVMLEVGRQFPELVKPATALLEAPVLPQAKPAGPEPGKMRQAVTEYMLPVVFSLMRNISEKNMLRNPMMHPANPEKTELLRTIFSSQKQYRVCVENISNLVEWQRKHFHDIYDNFDDIRVLVGEKDHVLSRRAMIESAKSRDSIKIIETKNTNHFITLEQPHYVLSELA